MIIIMLFFLPTFLVVVTIFVLLAIGEGVTSFFDD